MRASFPRAIAWLAFNDNPAWVYDDDWIAPITACLVADLFGKNEAFVRSEILRYREREGLERPRG